MVSNGNKCKLFCDTKLLSRDKIGQVLFPAEFTVQYVVFHPEWNAAIRSGFYLAFKLIYSNDTETRLNWMIMFPY